MNCLINKVYTDVKNITTCSSSDLFSAKSLKDCFCLGTLKCIWFHLGQNCVFPFLQRSRRRGHHGTKQKGARGATQTSGAAAHPSSPTTTAAAAAAATTAGAPAGCHSAASSTPHTTTANHTEPTRPTEGARTPPRAGEETTGSGECLPIWPYNR